jgi:hypothetical protein
MTKNERFGLVFVKTRFIHSGIDVYTVTADSGVERKYRLLGLTSSASVRMTDSLERNRQNTHWLCKTSCEYLCVQKSTSGSSCFCVHGQFVPNGAHEVIKESKDFTSLLPYQNPIS